MTDVGALLADLDATGVDEAVAVHCAEAPERLYGLGAVPSQRPDLAVDLLDRAMTEDGL